MDECMEIGQLNPGKAKAEKWMAGLLAGVLLCSAILEGTPLDFTISMLRSDGLVTEMVEEDTDHEKNAQMKAFEMESSDVTEDNAIGALAEVIPEEEIVEIPAAVISGEEIVEIPAAVISGEEIVEISATVIPDGEIAKIPVTVIPDGETAKIPEIVIPDENITDVSIPNDSKEEIQGEVSFKPSEPLVKELPDDTMQEVPAVETAFVIDEEGMLCEFHPEYAEITDGVLALPKEGCTGIRSGAFSDCGAEIYEIYIPATISVIEEGAFSGLDFLEWIEAEEGNPGCCSIDGVLFDETATVLLAFANGRIGNYLVPRTVTRIGDCAFMNTSITALDLRRCKEVTFGNNVFGNAADTVKLLMP